MRRGLLLGQVLLGSVGPPAADAVLVLELVMGVGLVVGGWLARLGRYRQHAVCQSLMVLINAAVIVIVMVPSFSLQVYPRIPARLGKAYYALATAHAAAGSLAEIAALYILVAAGTNVLPAGLRIGNYKVWMRCVVGLWWMVLVLGVATYVRWYVRV